MYPTACSPPPPGHKHRRERDSLDKLGNEDRYESNRKARDSLDKLGNEDVYQKQLDTAEGGSDGKPAHRSRPSQRPNGAVSPINEGEGVSPLLPPPVDPHLHTMSQVSFCAHLSTVSGRVIQ